MVARSSTGQAALTLSSDEEMEDLSLLAILTWLEALEKRCKGAPTPTKIVTVGCQTEYSYEFIHSRDQAYR